MIKKGFTLIELIIVIGIIALLATTVILVINPAKIFQEARDSQRIADMGQLNTAMGLYFATVSVYDLAEGAGVCLADWWGSITAIPAASQPFALPAITEASQALSATPRFTNGTGWIPVNFNLITSGSPLSALPVDPRNNNTGLLTGPGLFYAYACDSTNNYYEFNTRMESTRYANLGADDVESTDGGSGVDIFEVGNAPGLAL